ADIRDRLAGIEKLLLKMADPAPDPLGKIPNIEPPEANTANTWQDFIKSLMPLLLKLMERNDSEPTVKVIPPPTDYIGIATRLTTLEERLREVSAKQIQKLMERIAGLDRDMEIYKGSIDRIRTDIDKLDSHLIEHNKRISELEAIRSPREAEQATERLAERIRVLEQAAKKSERIQ
ncbi:MAG: hypothetical protein MPL62_04415, partial [Alphaproteobacteria bacterium]|nr:hypothetical protein [Alphaproteobacteria bacterium]